MTLFTVDVSSWDGLDIDWSQALQAGITAACVKATEGGGPGYRYTNPYLTEQYDRAVAAGLPLVGSYHCLSAESVDAQIRYWLQALGGRERAPNAWFMLDVEPFEELTSRGLGPDWGHVVAFCSSWWSLTQRPLALYLPHWVWLQFGAPDLTSLPGSIALVSSNYPSLRTAPFRDLYVGDVSGPGWLPYGGRTPDLWQYTSAGLVPGIRAGLVGVDVNAYRGSLAQLTYALTGGVTPPPIPTPQGDDMMTHWTNVQRGSTGDAVRIAQGLLIARGLGVGSSNGLPDGRFGPTTEASVRQLQQQHGLAVDGIFGPHTLSVALYGRDLG